jgi:hypothetical protein
MELTSRKEKHAHVECNHVGNLENGCLGVLVYLIVVFSLE